MKTIFRHFTFGFGLIGFAVTAHAQPAPTKSSAPALGTLRVAVVQMRSEPDVKANVAKVIRHLSALAAKGVQVVAFPECALSNYDPAAVHVSAETLVAAENEVAAACRQSALCAIVGTTQQRGGQAFNQALIIDAQGRIMARYDKVYLTDLERRWGFTSGTGLPPVFPVAGVQASIMICHDSRFPELVRLPVLAGARVIFYVSHEAGIIKESKMVPYRAQVQARAVENDVFVVHANAPANDVRTGSHGQSRIVQADGNIMQEAGQLQEEVLVADLNLADATAERARESMEGPFGDWWREGLKRVPIVQ